MMGLGSVVQASCLLTMQAGARVTDVQWSPFRGTLFAVTTEVGSVQLWDLQATVHSPVKSIDLSGLVDCLIASSSNPRSGLMVFASKLRCSGPARCDSRRLLNVHESVVRSSGGATCVLFVPNMPSLVVGGAAGGVR